jgi:hypothetical protein
MNDVRMTQQHLKAQETQARRYFDTGRVKNVALSSWNLGQKSQSYQTARTPHMLMQNHLILFPWVQWMMWGWPNSIWRPKRQKTQAGRYFEIGSMKNVALSSLNLGQKSQLHQTAMTPYQLLLNHFILSLWVQWMMSDDPTVSEGPIETQAMT